MGQFPEFGLILITAVDPTAGAGVPGLPYQFLWRTTTNSLYVKTGVANTAWTIVSAGSLNVHGSGNVAGHAFAHCEPPGSLTANIGFSGVVRNGVGDYTLTMDSALDTNLFGTVNATVQDNTGDTNRRNITVQSLSDTQLRVRTFKNAAASEEHFWISVWHVNP